MELKVYKCLWGVAEINEAAINAYKLKGYDGIEWKALHAVKHKEFTHWLADNDLDFIAQIHTGGGLTVDDHLYSFENLVNLSLSLHPVIINSQSGCDHWNFKERCAFIEGALRMEQQYKVPVAHETHRSRITYNPWNTEALVKEFPDMKVCCDFSHWVTVCERLLTTEQEQINAVVKAAIHIHARVGYEQGPQVPDPRAPEYENQVKAHESWWQTIWQAQQKRGLETITVCPEYGPPPYQHTMPYSQQPVSKVEEICDWASDRIRIQFNETITIK